MKIVVILADIEVTIVCFAHEGRRRPDRIIVESTWPKREVSRLSESWIRKIEFAWCRWSQATPPRE